MLYAVVKAALSGVIVLIVSEVAKRYPGWGGLIASLPLISILGIIWLWNDTGDTTRIANHAEATFWFVLPSLPMFLVFPTLLRANIAFWPALAASSLLTIALYALMVWLLPKFGITL
jgi:hypothetical protein